MGNLAQWRAGLRKVHTPVQITEFHHGDCVGADDQAANMVNDMCNSERHRPVKIVCHPPADNAHRAYNGRFDDLRPVQTHFARNRAIVSETDVLVATPWQDKEPPPKTGGGTWYTIEYARKLGRRVVIVWPNGSVSDSKGAGG